ncbi:hypothetical protein KY349_00295 [Candidatus Woesearchaeota archaeon]|nr:hypothetical protein [Candidatus Woesearchaeota archaeon]
MLNLDISRLKIKNFSALKKKLASIKKKGTPAFEQHKEDIEALKQALKKYRKYKNLILIGNGGSNTSFKAFHNALVHPDSKKKAFILTTMEPDLIEDIKSVFPRRKTLVMPVSKSGNTVGILEVMFAFEGYRMLPVTTPDSGALSTIAKKQSLDIIPHAPVGGRFSGLTASALAPALFLDIDAESIDNGARTMYKYCNPAVPLEKNPALQLAASLYLLEKKGFIEIFCPIYSSKLAGAQNLIVQLIHETVGKKGKGQTIFCADAPESQHHTNQRFFGGRKNVLGVFVTVGKQEDIESKVSVPDSVKSLKIRDGSLSDIDGVPYAKALEFEFRGTWEDAIKHKIPCAHINIDKVSPFSMGEFMAFWHYVAVYSAWLRDLDAFDQPQVETSKEISFRLRKEYKS